MLVPRWAAWSAQCCERVAQARTALPGGLDAEESVWNSATDEVIRGTGSSQSDMNWFATGCHRVALSSASGWCGEKENGGALADSAIPCSSINPCGQGT